MTTLGKRAADFIREADPFGDHFSVNELKDLAGEPKRLSLQEIHYQNCPCGGFDCSAIPGGPLYNCPYVTPSAVTSLPPLVDRAELVALLEDLASVNLSPDACSRQASRMADDLIARGLTALTFLNKQNPPPLRSRAEVLKQKGND